MVTMVTIGGLPVDAEDPCALKTALEAVRLKMVAGEHVEEMSIQSPTTRETVRFSSANYANLDKEIQRLDGLCRQKQGKCRAARRWNFRY